MRHFLWNLLILLVALGIAGYLLYPTISDQIAQYQAEQVISASTAAVRNLTEREIQRLWQAGEDYNLYMAEHGEISVHDAFTSGNASNIDPEGHVMYEETYNILGDGVMGILEVPKAGIRLPIYHGTDEQTLLLGAGHLEGTSLPSQGTSTHVVLCSHRGLDSARLFTDLDQMARGDLIQLEILGSLITYEVDRILTVEPEESEWFQIEEGQSYITLVTTTPLNDNTHRLLIRGQRVEPDDEALQSLSAAKRIDREGSQTVLADWITALIIAVPLLIIGVIILAIFLLIKNRQDEKYLKRMENQSEE